MDTPEHPGGKFDYSRWESISDVGQGLGNIISGTAKGFGYDLSDPQDLATSLVISSILPGPLKQILKNVKKGAKAAKTVTKTAKKAKKAKPTKPKDMKPREDIGKSVKPGTTINTNYRKALNTFLSPIAGRSGTLFGSGKYSDYGVNFLKNLQNIKGLKTSPWGYLGDMRKSLQQGAKYGLGKFGTAPNLYSLWEGIAGEPFSERTESGSYLGGISNTLLESYTNYYSPVMKFGTELAMNPTLLNLVQPLLDIGASEEYLKEREKSVNDAIDSRYDVKVDSSKNSIDTILRLLGVPDSKEPDSKKTVPVKPDSTKTEPGDEFKDIFEDFIIE